MKLFRVFKHKCKFTILVADMPMKNNTNLITHSCKCGKVEQIRVHRESEYYLNLLTQNKEDEKDIHY